MSSLIEVLAATNGDPERLDALKPWLNPSNQHHAQLVLDNPDHVNAIYGISDFAERLASPCTPEAWRTILTGWTQEVATDLLNETTRAIQKATSVEGVASKLADIRAKFQDATRSHVVEDIATLLLTESLEPVEMDLGSFADQIGLSPIERGNLIVLAGPTGFGKTAAALRMTVERAVAEQRTHYISLEMSRPQLQKRFLSLLLNEPLQTLGQFDPNETFAETINAIKDNVLIHYFTGNFAALQDILDTHIDPGDLVVIDHALLIGISNTQNRTDAYTEMTRWLKGFSRMRDAVTLLLTQLRRDGGDGAPDLSDLSWSSSFAWDADLVVMLYGDASGNSYAKIAKSRQGDQQISVLDQDWQHTLLYPSERETIYHALRIS